MRFGLKNHTIDALILSYGLPPWNFLVKKAAPFMLVLRILGQMGLSCGILNKRYLCLG
jgi:hypothetical protein